MEIIFRGEGCKRYVISNMEGVLDYPLFISNEDGEGFAIKEKDLFKVLDEFFKKEF
ncbi:MAG: hypothetical protein ACE5R3_05430 [Nitrosopumilaceae archaeon]